MSRLHILMLFAILGIFTVKPNLNAIAPVEQRVKREQLGCCIKKLWESSKEVWDSEEACSPKEFVVRPTCHYDITYDAEREMFSYETYASNRTDTHCYHSHYFYGCFAASPTDRKHANRASLAIREFRAKSYPLDRMDFAPQITWNCLFYAGNNDKPTCHNISNAEAIRNTSRCIYIYDLVTQKLRFANRTCVGAQQLVSWSSDKDGCVRHNNSLEYTCVGVGKFRQYKEIIDKEEGCCVYKNKVWESNATVWESEYYGCNAPADFVAGRGCFYSVTYDTKWEMFSLTSLDGPGYADSGWECRTGATNELYCKEGPQTREKATPASTWFKFVRQKYMSLIPTAPQTDFFCLYYAGNDDKPTCHNITSVDEIRTNAKCVHVYDPTTQKFRFANRTCEGAQQLVTWPSTKDGCFRYENSWEYTCIYGGHGMVQYTKNLENSKLPPTPTGCCKRAKFRSSGCDDDAFMRVQPLSNVSCHFITLYHDERRDSIEAVSFVAIYNQEGLVPDTTCNPVPESKGLYHCQCPAAGIRESHANTANVYEMTASRSQLEILKTKELEFQFRCCILHNLSTNDLSQWKQECQDNLDGKLTESKPNSSCHYILEKKSDTEPIKVLAMYQEFKDVPTASCSPIKESANHHHCQCPSSNIYSNPVEGCLKGIFDVMKDAKVEPSPSFNQITTQKPKEARPPKFCCDYTNILSTQISLMPRECGSESWKQVESNADCHYVLEKKSSSKHAKVLLLIFNGVQVESGISCKPIENAVGLYHCNCPAASDQSTKECLWGMFNMVGDLQKNSSGALH